jgi:hypothetical protein
VKFTKKRLSISIFIILGISAFLISNSDVFTEKPDFVSAYEIGDVGPAGGNIFYIDESSEFKDFDYLESAPASCEGQEVLWALTADELDAAIKLVSTWEEATVGSGKGNTEAMLAAGSNFYETNTASGFAHSLDCGGQSDWFVPSKSELDLMYQNLAKQKIGDFTTGYYWSSSAYEYGRAWNQPFSVGEAFDGNKDGKFAVRPIRAF